MTLRHSRRDSDNWSLATHSEAPSRSSAETHQQEEKSWAKKEQLESWEAFFLSQRERAEELEKPWNEVHDIPSESLAKLVWRHRNFTAFDLLVEESIKSSFTVARTEEFLEPPPTEVEKWEVWSFYSYLYDQMQDEFEKNRLRKFPGQKDDGYPYGSSSDMIEDTRFR
ncbi:unnamed protein product [Amoebophrya sp. A25]|nr:unnamed protein product [Amoebophrya sp. A25]|eukprot:GSA25T00027819001.1